MSRVLVIDDDEMVLKAVSMYLGENGFTMSTTADGPQGIIIYKSEYPDIVILDIGLPTIDGLEVLKQILKFDSKAKVIIVSGYNSSKIALDAIENGAFAFISKPFDGAVLIQTIDQALKSVI